MQEKSHGDADPAITIRRIEEVDSIVAEAISTLSRGRIEIEIGSGNGHFLVAYGEKAKDTFLIGIELKKKRCLKILKKIKNRSLHNITVVQEKAEVLLQRLPPRCIDHYHVYFPDPWPKTRHRRRRFIRKSNLDILCNTLKPGGRLSFATDFFDYSVQAKLLLLLHPGFTLMDDNPPEEVFLSVYANKFMDHGQKIYLMTARKNE
ncbi:MAG: hypothetical protein JW881_05115 [Spirochaetales bacterium]|nr:hypothetical protein [Spirochaetales bacterium]